MKKRNVTSQPTPSESSQTQGSLSSSSNLTTESSPRDLEHQKLELEIQKLRIEIQTGSFGFELFKALATLATIAGIIFTVYTGLVSQRQAQASRDDDRFDKAITRLGGAQSAERLTGIASLQQFIRSFDSEKRESALKQLVNAAVIEHDPTVRSVLLDVFNGLASLKSKSGSLNGALEAARDRNRAILKRLRDQFFEQAGSSPVDPQYDESLIGKPSKSDKESLDASAEIIASLVRAGASISDLSNIYCVGCEFSTPTTPAQLDGVKFDGAVLSRAIFSGAQLSFASFHNAALLGTRFINANLASAKITFDVPAMAPAAIKGEMGGNLMIGQIGPVFACANLSGADLAGTVIFRLIYENPVWGGNNIEFYGANLDNADLSKAQIQILIPERLAMKGTSLMPMLPDELIPITWGQSSGPGQATKYFDKENYLLWTSTWITTPGKLKPIPSAYWPDLRAAMISLYAAKNLDKAKLPIELRAWMIQSRSAIEKPISSYNCSDVSYY